MWGSVVWVAVQARFLRQRLLAQARPEPMLAHDLPKPARGGRLSLGHGPSVLNGTQSGYRILCTAAQAAAQERGTDMRKMGVVLLAGVALLAACSDAGSGRDTSPALAPSSGASGDSTGLSESQRRQVFTEIVKSEDRAANEAEERYPTDAFCDGYSADNIEKNIDLTRELEDRYRAEVARHPSLSSEQLRTIGLEGVLNGWPLPALTLETCE